VIAARGGFRDAEIGAEPRDAAALPGRGGVLILRADEGITRVPLKRWRFADGARLLAATAASTPRKLTRRDLTQLQTLPVAGP
jgi:hypothetical protein